MRKRTVSPARQAGRVASLKLMFNRSERLAANSGRWIYVAASRIRLARGRLPLLARQPLRGLNKSHDSIALSQTNFISGSIARLIAWPNGPDSFDWETSRGCPRKV